MKRIVFFLFSIFLVCNTNLHAQENKDIDKYKEFLDYAHQSFNSGDYDKAKTHLTAYKRFTSDSASVHNFEQQIDLCIEIKNNTQEAERKGDYSKALGYYLSLQRNNPKDPNVSGKITLLQNLVSQMDSNKNSTFDSATVYHIGDKYTERYSDYIICYLDSTNRHGWIMTDVRKTSYYPLEDHLIKLGWRRPNKEELYMIYKNRHALGLNGRYWTSTRSRKVGNWDFYYTLDFGTGDYKSTDSYKDYLCFYIKNF